MTYVIGAAKLLVITQEAVDLAYTEIGIQLTILRKASDCDEKCIIYVDVAVIYTNI